MSDFEEVTAVAGGTIVSTTETPKLSDSQRERIARNKEKAKSIRQARLQSSPYDVNTERRAQQHSSFGEFKNMHDIVAKSSCEGTRPTGVCSTAISGGGFLLEDEDDPLQERNYRLVEEDGMSSLCSTFVSCMAVDISRPRQHSAWGNIVAN